MNIDKRMICIGAICLLILTGLAGCIHQPGPGSGIILIPAATTLTGGNPKYSMASYYSSDGITIESNVPQYTLPLTMSSIVNSDTVNQLFDLQEAQKELLATNGFVVIDDWKNEDDIVEPYNYLKENDMAIFVTSDTLLHLYHIQFDEILKGIEEREFFDNILDLSFKLFNKSISDYENFTNVDLKEAARRNIAFFGVGLSLLQTPTNDYDGSEDIREVTVSFPEYVEAEVTEELLYINSQEGYHESPIFHYNEDYTQYKPRGHYTQSEKLQRYFKAMMWYGRMMFLMKGGEPYCQSCDFLISEENAKIQTIQSSLIATALPVEHINNESLEAVWTRIYSVTSFFVGTADDLTPYEYLDCIIEVFGSEFNITDFSDDEKLLNLKIKLTELRSPEIYGGTGQVVVLKPSGIFTVEDLNDILEKTKGMRLMGQRFIPDSYMFQQLVSPAVGLYIGEDEPFTMKITNAGPARTFPRGLDVMAVLGSHRAVEILENEGDTQYKYYYDQLNNLMENFSRFNITEWNRNLYFSWIYTLQSLLKEYNTSYPSFMQTTAWLDKQLQTVLGSWAELRHDTILYGKQSYTPILVTGIPPFEEPKPVVGYVEPVPEFYSRILALTKMTRTGLTDLNVLNTTETIRLEQLELTLQRLINISIEELEGRDLTDDDYQFIRNFGENLDDIVTGVYEEGKETTIIADVHTDTNPPEEVLEEGVGYIDLIIVAYKVPDGRIICGAGPVFSYYEFKHPMNDRLTDEQWKDMLQTGSEPPRPSWTSSFLPE